MAFLSNLLSWTSFVLAAVTCLLGPWLFGAWEMWWFWPFAVCLFGAVACFAARGVLRVLRAPSEPDSGQVPDTKARLLLCAAFVPFLVYAAVRLVQTPVFMDAERSFLLFLSPVLLGAVVVFGFSRKQVEFLYLFLLLDLLLLGLYGLVNHAVTGSHMVLWMPGFPQYIIEKRATGSYYCPDHFAGIMELMLCLALGLVLARETPRARRLLAALLVVTALTGIVLSKSRGGGLAVLVVLAAAFAWGLLQWPRVPRFWLRSTAAGACLLVLVAFALAGDSYIKRFASYFGWQQMRADAFETWRPVLKKRLLGSSRGRMISGALRAWRSAPVVGIGPGMHRHLWPHFAASPDGDRERKIWPTYPNYQFHSYHVHSDWVQLLEEYGVIGFVLFLFPAGLGTLMLYRGLSRRARRDRHARSVSGHGGFGLMLGAFLCCLCMAFHSLGDFNLQMPATTWLLAAIAAAGLHLATVEPAKSTG